MNGIILTADEQEQVSKLAQRMSELSAADLDAAHRAWQQAARNIADYQTARRLYMEHVALEMAVAMKLERGWAWEKFAFQQAFGDRLYVMSNQ